MIGISKLICNKIEPSDILRYKNSTERIPSHLLQFSKDTGPVVVWNITKQCNLKCIHCYSQSDDKKDSNELSFNQCKKIIKDLSGFGVPVILFSGGEPLMRNDILELIEYTTSCNIRAVLSTNGILITKDIARNLKEAGITYVGISIDGIESTHDSFRNVKWAYKKTFEGIKNCQKAEIKVGLRCTITKQNMDEIPDIFKFITDNDIPRICFYHLVNTGRGQNINNMTLTKDETRKTIDLIIDLTKRIHESGFNKEVLTVDNHADGVYLYLKMLKEDKNRAENILKLLEMNGGNGSGDRIICISWDGKIYPDQFLRDYSFGNIKEKQLDSIWEDYKNPLINKFKNKKDYLKGRCSKCFFLDICNGNLRARAKALTGDLWEEDPGCYLTDEEIAMPLKN